MTRYPLDLLHEYAIRRAFVRLLRYPTAANVRKHSDLIRARSPEQMARIKGTE